MLPSVIALLIAAISTFIVFASRKDRRIAEARSQAQRQISASTAEAKALKHTIIKREKKHSAAHAAALESDEQQVLAEIKVIEERNTHLEKMLQSMESRLQERKKQADRRASLIGQNKKQSEVAIEEAATRRANVLGELERRAGVEATQLVVDIASQMVEETKAKADDTLRNYESFYRDEAEAEAFRLMTIAIQRHSGHYLRDRRGSYVDMDEKGFKRLTSDNAAAMEKLDRFLGTCDFSETRFEVDDSSKRVRIDSGDGAAKEFSRRAFKRLCGERIKNPEGLFSAIKRDFDREIFSLGRKAFSRLKIKRAADEIVQLLGELNWRTSYTQNQYEHSIEAGFFGATIASELGLNHTLMRRGCLMHDMAKVLTPHRVEGSHALIGAEIARKHGEDEQVCNGIGAHHGEEPMNSPYAWLVAACDAMSGGRPGARREANESYSDRVGELEQIASSFDGVENVNVVQAGREVIVFVNEKAHNDDGLSVLSSDIAERISGEVVFPGQIKVTVIREFHAIEYAG